MKFTMYYGFSQMLEKVGIEKTAEYASKMGFESVEILADFYFGNMNPIPDVESARKVRAVLEMYNLPVACYSVCMNLWSSNAAKQKTKEQQMFQLVDVAAELGAPYFHHTLLPYLKVTKDMPDFDRAVAAAVEAAVKIADYAKQYGIICIYEDQGCYINGVNGFKAFFSEMKCRCDNVGICGDLGNILFVNEYPQDFLQEFISDIKHVHVKDYLMKQSKESPGWYWLSAKDDIWLRDTMIGSGVVDFKTCMDILKQAGYTGRFALENGHPEPYEQGVYQAMEYLDRIWRTS